MSITDRAAAEAQRRHEAGETTTWGDPRSAFIAGAEWHASQPVTDAEVLAALNTDFAARHPNSEPSDTLDDYGTWHVQTMRATLTAAKEAQ